ncbi:MAG: ComEC/Rec2 family competence protein [Clostridia bacterium]|nr:ComEC/Rec2 family competence protein [Clostridia bacterium]
MKKRKNRRVPFLLLAALLICTLFAGCSQTQLDAAFSSAAPSVSSASASKAPPAGLTVCYIDVGQGDSIFIDCNGSTMLIDAGIPDMGSRVTACLDRYGITKLDDVICTHPHDDHIGGIPLVLQSRQVSRIFMTKATNNTQSFENLLTAISKKGLKATVPSPGQSYTLGGASFTVLAPTATYTDLNDMSIVIRLTYKGKSFLFTGDASFDSENDMLKKGYNLKADVLKVGHHGSATASGAAFLKAVSPQYAVISVGKDNDYGHPTKAALTRLQKAGAKVLRTDLNGTVVFYYDGKKLSYTTEK